MKFKFLFSLLLGSALTMSAQGYKDGIEYYKADQLNNAKSILERTLNDASTDKSMSYYYLGQIALNAGDKAAAIKNFNDGINANPENGYNYVGLGAVELLNGNEKVADASFKTARKFAKKDDVLITDIARAYYNADPVKYAEDIAKCIKDALKANKASAAIMVFQGDVDADNEKIGDAAAKYENAIYNNPNAVEAYVKYANVYFPVNARFAIGKLKELLNLQPNSALAQRELAEKYYQNDQLTLSAQQYGEYIKNPNHFKEDEERYAVLLYFGKNYDESYNLAQRILNEDPNSFLMYRILFLNKAAKQEYPEARTLAENFFTKKGQFTSNDYMTYGTVLKELGEDSLAVMQVEKAVALDPQNIDLLRELSSVYSGKKDYAKAAEAYQRIIDNCDYNTNDLLMATIRYTSLASTSVPGSEEKVNAIAKAVNYIDQVIERAPDNYTVYQRKARVMIAKDDSLRTTAEAVDVYKQMLEVLDKEPNNKVDNKKAYIEAYNLIAGYYFDNDDLDNAILYYEKYLGIDPENAALQEYVATLKEKQAKLKK